MTVAIEAAGVATGVATRTTKAVATTTAIAEATTGIACRTRTGGLARRRLHAFDGVHFEAVAGITLDRTNEAGFTRAGERDRDAVTTGTACAADAVHVVFGLTRRIEVDDVADAGNVNAAGGDVGRDQHTNTALTQAIKRAVTLRLVHVAMQSSSGDALFLQRQRQFISTALGGGKHQSLIEPLARKQGFEEAILVTKIVGKHQALLDLTAVFLSNFDFDALRITRHAVGHAAHHAVKRGREHQGLTRGRGGGDDGVDVFGKTHVQHAVSFVEDQHLNVRQLDLAPIQVVEQATGGGDDDVALALQLLDLGEHRRAADEAGGVEPAQGLAVSLHRLLDLLADLDAQVSALAEDGGSALGASLSSTFAALGTRPAARALPPTRPTWITTFQSGHGWVDSLASGTMVDDTDTGDFILGAQSIHIVNSTAQKTGLGLDLTGKHLVVRLRVNAFTAGHTVAVYANDGSWSNFKVWDIVATADEQKKHFQAGEWVYVTLPWDGASSTTGTPNRAAIDTIRIRPVTQGDIHVQAIGYASEGAQTAGKVTFTFDDGYTSWLTLAAPTLAARGIRATGFVIPDFDGVAGYLTAAQCRTLQDTYGWDMQMHGDNDLSTLTAAQMRTEWTRGKKWFATNGLGRAEHIAYPYGQTDAETIATAAEFFTSGRTIARANPLESWPPAMPLRMRAVSGVSSAAGGTNVAAAKAMIDKAVAGKQWLILTFHVIGASAPDTMWCTTSDLAEIADYAAASGAEVPTIADAFA